MGTTGAQSQVVPCCTCAGVVWMGGVSIISNAVMLNRACQEPF